jgi:amino acid adenylation domain-containing protein
LTRWEEQMLSLMEQSPALPAIEPVARSAALPLSFSQEALWLIHEINPGLNAYNIYDAVRLKGRLRVEALERALQEIVKRHESLRTTFSSRNGQAFQEISAPGVFTISTLDLREIPEGKREAELRRLAATEVQKPFVLAGGPLFRASLFRLEAEQHLLLLTMHHLIFDEWSQGILRRELASLYAAFCQGKDSPLAALPLQYADFAIWQRKCLQGEELRKHLAYWKQRLEGIPVALELPADHARPPVQTFQGASRSFEVPLVWSDELAAIGKKQGALLFMVLLAALDVLLHRYSGQEDIVVGVPVAGRNQRETENITGFFVNMLALRTNLSGNPSFLELLDRVREAFLGAFSHESVPFEKVVAELQPKRDNSRNPIFQVSLTFSVAAQEFQLPGLEASSYEVERGACHFDLAFFLQQTQEGIRGNVEYNTDLFDSATIGRLTGHYRRLLEGVVENPDRCLSKLPLLTREEERTILIEWNSTEAEYPRKSCIHELFEAQAARTPEAVAVMFEDQQLTFRELDRRANRLARRLRAAGVGPNQLVGIYVERSLDMVIGVLGILKAGGAYVPMDPAFPAERLGFMIVTQASLVAGLPPHKAMVLTCDASGDDLAAPEFPIRNPQPEDLAYVIFTSGSTGRPKGVQIPHRAVVNFLNSMRREPGLSPEDVLLAVTTLSFDIAGLELFLPLTTGATVAIAPREALSDGNLLKGELERVGATIMQATPVTWRLLLEAGWKGDPKLKILLGGEAVPRELVNRLAPLCGSLWNVYGPTETTIWSTTTRVKGGTGPVSIGRPIDNTQVYVVGPALQLQPVGVPGELLIGGAGLARGYLGRPELTAEKFIPNPFVAMDGSVRLYRTGDLARWRPDGTLECLGRLDNQVKLRGFRIELGEIEALLDSHPTISRSAAIVREDTEGEKRLVAYFVVQAGKEASIGELHQFLKEKLPDYMVPSAFVILPEFPLTPNRKIDRKALPKLGKERSDSRAEPVAPRTEREEQLCRIWTAVLGVDRISVHDDFFDLGGYSLMVFRAISLINNRFTSNLQPAAIFEHRTIARLSTLLEADGSTPAAAAVPVSPDGSLQIVADLVGSRGKEAQGTPANAAGIALDPRVLRSSATRWACNMLINCLPDLWIINECVRPALARLCGMRCGSRVQLEKGTFYGNPRNVRIGSRSSLGRLCFLDGYDKITIGNHVDIGFQVTFITSAHEIGTEASRAGEGFGKPIVVGDGVWIAARVVIGPGTEIGAGSVISAGAVVENSVPPNSLVAGAPAQVIAELPRAAAQPPCRDKPAWRPRRTRR